MVKFAPVPTSNQNMSSPTDVSAEDVARLRHASAVGGFLVLGLALLAAAALFPPRVGAGLAMGTAVLRDLAATALFAAGTLALIWRRRLAAGVPRAIRFSAYWAALAVIAWRVVVPLLGGLFWFAQNAQAA